MDKTFTRFMYQIKNSSLKIGNILIEYIITGTEHIIASVKVQIISFIVACNIFDVSSRCIAYVGIS